MNPDQHISTCVRRSIVASVQASQAQFSVTIVECMVKRRGVGRVRQPHDLTTHSLRASPPPSRLAQESDRVRDEVKYASSLAKAGSVAVRGIYWDPSMDATSIQTAQGLVFPVRLHNSFLLEDPRILLGGEDSVVLKRRRRSSLRAFAACFMSNRLESALMSV